MGNGTNSKMKPVVAKVKIDEQKSDFAYWHPIVPRQPGGIGADQK